MEFDNLPGAWVLEIFRRGGVDLEVLSKRLPEDVHLMLYEMDTVQPDTINRLLQACADISGNDSFGLIMNEWLDLTMYGLFGYLLLNSGTVEDLFDTLIRYYRVHHKGGLYYEKIPHKNVVHIRFCYDLKAYSSHRHTTDWGLGFIPYYLKSALGHLAIPLSAQFAYTAPENLKKLHTYFGENLTFNQTHNQVTYHRSILNRRIVNANPGLLKILREQANKRLLDHKNNSSLFTEINMLLFESLGQKKINSTDVAAALGLSISTFKRTLVKEGIDFRATKNAVKNNLAKQLLSDTTIKVSEIAQKTGFSNAGSFTRFFIRCNQMKPLEYRNSDMKST